MKFYFKSCLNPLQKVRLNINKANIYKEHPVTDFKVPLCKLNFLYTKRKRNTTDGFSLKNQEENVSCVLRKRRKTNRIVSAYILNGVSVLALLLKQWTVPEEESKIKKDVLKVIAA